MRDLPDFRSPDFLRAHIQHTLAFYAPRNLDASGGFFHFYRDDGTVYERVERHLVSSTRFVFNHAMAWRHFGQPEDQRRARHGLRFLSQGHQFEPGRGCPSLEGPNPGHAWRVRWDGQRAELLDGTLHAYGQAFVLLAHAHALMAGVDEARAGLQATAERLEARFWEPAQGLYADEIAPDGTLQPYRGQNANMHGCEAMLAAHEATGEAFYLQRALTLAESVTQRLAGLADGLVWEHYRHDARGAWVVDWDYNREDKTNIFRPWGFQTGHLTEWTKLLLQLRARLAAGAQPEPTWLLPTARHFFDTAMARGWDGVHGGLVYGFGPDGAVCDADKYFWVQAESLAAAAGLAVATGEAAYWQWYDRLWAYAWAHMIDHRHGAWYRIRTPDNRAYSDEKSPAGKTDYHTMGACYDVLRFLGA
ncbi:AGE family epimerase/isomerase [Ideonella livida]|uniref:AGE family epimerase/isomerase n=1 Tax=Ideonella livida TaxID=2707176 RepID=A0A7C9PK22_9BURK|nr:AGE family epimerase/isomerase [Ideonella livida]NDY93151.1 AGE family epimerase/isomerase [Ideonella livida]